MSGAKRTYLQSAFWVSVVQLRNIADVVAEGSWVDAAIEAAIPDRQPLPKADIRNMLVPIGQGLSLA